MEQVHGLKVLSFRDFPRQNNLMDIINHHQAAPFITADGSEIRELLAPRNSSLRHQSLAEAIVPVNGATREHFHPRAEEIYYILEGQGLMRIGTEERSVGPLDAIAIPPGHKHKIWNTGKIPLLFLCCCAPAYEHHDTVLLE